MVNNEVFKSNLGPFWVPKNGFQAHFEVYLGHFDFHHVPETLEIEVFWDPKERIVGPKCGFQLFAGYAGYAPRRLRHMFVAHFAAIVCCLEAPYSPNVGP